MAPLGHSGSHTSQLIQTSVIINAIMQTQPRMLAGIRTSPVYKDL